MPIFSKVSSIGGASSASQTRPANTTAYSIGDVIGTDAATNLVFENVLTMAAGHFIIMGVSVRFDTASTTVAFGALRLHLYDAAPTAITDNSAFNLIAADRNKYLGWIDIDAPVDIGDTHYISMNNVNTKRKLADGSTTLYGVLETRAANQCAENSTPFTVKLHVVGA
jgi:hypothetical protein